MGVYIFYFLLLWHKKWHLNSKDFFSFNKLILYTGKCLSFSKDEESICPSHNPILFLFWNNFLV